MKFDDKQPIYLQIADHFCSQIISGKWKSEERIPSVREVASLLEVNPNTAMRAYHYLQEQEIISQQRGVGYFVNGNAKDKIIKLMREQFICDELPEFFRKMEQLGYSLSDIQKIYDHQNNGSSS